jgi:hypothetical protein
MQSLWIAAVFFSRSYFFFEMDMLYVKRDSVHFCMENDSMEISLEHGFSWMGYGWACRGLVSAAQRPPSYDSEGRILFIPEMGCYNRVLLRGNLFESH